MFSVTGVLPPLQKMRGEAKQTRKFMENMLPSILSGSHCRRKECEIIELKKVPSKLGREKKKNTFLIYAR